MRIRPLLFCLSPVLLVIGCGGADPQTTQAKGSSEDPVSTAPGSGGSGGVTGGGGGDAGVSADGSGGPPCERNADCKDDEICGFPTAKVCASYGECFPRGPVCNMEDLGCACDGTTIGIECVAGLPPGYAPKPLEHRGACVSDAGPACSGGGMGNANGVCSSDLAFFQSAEEGCVASKQYLTTFSPDEKCGVGSSNKATYTCCPKAPTGCSGGGGGNANGVCSSDNSFFASAEEDCTARKLSVTAFSSDEKCGPGSSNSFTYSCCP
jgi:hypothetical protein